MRKGTTGEFLEVTTFKPDFKREGLGYTVMIGQGLGAYLVDNKLKVVALGSGERKGQTSEVYTHSDRHKICSLNYMFLDNCSRFALFCVDSRDAIMEIKPEEGNFYEHKTDTSTSRLQLASGNTFYSIEYNTKDPIHRFTFLKDLKKDNSIWNVWTSKWILKRITV